MNQPVEVSIEAQQFIKIQNMDELDDAEQASALIAQRITFNSIMEESLLPFDCNDASLIQHNIEQALEAWKKQGKTPSWHNVDVTVDFISEAGFECFSLFIYLQPSTKLHFVDMQAMITPAKLKPAKKEPSKGKKKLVQDCGTCNHCGADPDGPYCAAPAVVKDHSVGLALSSPTLAKLCPSPQHPLWEKTTR